ncbi:transporter substrate-binding domain-containing protein [Neisseriaceae bacterium ESL0693]|nr:transporter substrate-binding domain-containing protein [Neisseriaceae bacterium ESL0693]
MRNYLLGFLFVLSALMLAACNDKDTTQSQDHRTTIVVATSGSPSPFTTVNREGELVGYDIDVVKAIFAHLPQYQLVFAKTEFESVLAGLDAERYQVGANNFAMNQQRQQKYFYSDPIFRNQYVIAVAADNDQIKQFSDLKGKSTEATPGQNYATALENYNLRYPDHPVAIDYTDADLVTILRNVESGRYDFQLIDLPMLLKYIDQHHLNIKIIKLNDEDSDKIGSPYSYLLISKGKQGEQLIKDINQQIKTLIDNGQLSQISHTYFGADYSPKAKQ